MRVDNRSVCITLFKRPNGHKMKQEKPMRIPRMDADRLVDAGRATYTSKTIYRKAVKASLPENPEENPPVGDKKPRHPKRRRRDKKAKKS